MIKEPTIKLLQRKINLLEKEVIKFIHREDEEKRKQHIIDYGHIKRTKSLMNIIHELHRELRALASDNNVKLRTVTNSLTGRTKELNSIYHITKLKSDNSLSVIQILQSVIDDILPAIPYSKRACARIVLASHTIQTSPFRESEWKLSKDIMLFKEKIGTLEIFYAEKFPEIWNEFSLEGTNNLLTAVAESIAQIVERENVKNKIKLKRVKI